MRSRAPRAFVPASALRAPPQALRAPGSPDSPPPTPVPRSLADPRPSSQLPAHWMASRPFGGLAPRSFRRFPLPGAFRCLPHTRREAPRPQPFIGPHCGDSTFPMSILGARRASVPVPTTVSPEALPPRKSGGCGGSWTAPPPPPSSQGLCLSPRCPHGAVKVCLGAETPLSQSHVLVTPMLRRTLAPGGQALRGFLGVRWHGETPTAAPPPAAGRFSWGEGFPGQRVLYRPQGGPTLGGRSLGNQQSAHLNPGGLSPRVRRTRVHSHPTVPTAPPSPSSPCDR